MSARSKTLVVGNWKMNGTRASTRELLPQLVAATAAVDADLAVCVPFPLLETASQLLLETQIALGAQDVSDQDRGAYTGQVSASMLQEFECRYVIVGHSERRVHQQESDDVVARKARAALRRSLVPIFCIGESATERDNDETEKVVLRQLEPLVELLRSEPTSRCVIAYEPVWAIGTGRSATAEQAQAVHALIRKRLVQVSPQAADDTFILYGGSVTPATAGALFAQNDIDGALVGGASLNVADFAAIVAGGH